MSISVAKNTFYLTVATIGQKFLAFFYFLFLANVMHVERTGVYFLALSITTILSVVADFGITPVVIREVAKKPDEAEFLIRRALGLKIPLIFLAFLGALLAVKILGYGNEVLFLVFLAAIVMAADAISLLYFGVLRGLHILRFESLGMMIGEFLIVCTGTISLLIHPSIRLLICALAVGSIFNAFFSASQVIKKLGWSIVVPKFDFVGIKKILKTSTPFALAGTFSKLYSYVDTILLSLFIGTAAVGIYSIAYRMTYAFQFLPMAFVAALYPGMSTLVGQEQKKLARLFEQAIWYLVILVVPITLGIFSLAPDLVLLAGQDYAAGAPVLRILVFVLIPLFLDFPIGSLLNAADRQGTKTAIMGGTMVINAGLNIVLIPMFGIVGAAYSALAGFWFMFLAGLYFVPQIIPDVAWRNLLWLFFKVFGCGIFMTLVTMFLRPIVGFFLVIPIAVIIYSALLFATRSIKLEQLKELRVLVHRKKAVAEIISEDNLVDL